MQEREKVLEGAEWYVYSHFDLLNYLKRSSVAVIGSGAWACAAARMVAQNTANGDPGDEFVDEVKMWVYEEDLNVRGILCCNLCINMTALRVGERPEAAITKLKRLIHH
jgi:glycerol-3-phosphate dehydrogenase